MAIQHEKKTWLENDYYRKINTDPTFKPKNVLLYVLFYMSFSFINNSIIIFVIFYKVYV